MCVCFLFCIVFFFAEWKLLTDAEPKKPPKTHVSVFFFSNPMFTKGPYTPAHSTRTRTHTHSHTHACHKSKNQKKKKSPTPTHGWKGARSARRERAAWKTRRRSCPRTRCFSAWSFPGILESLRGGWGYSSWDWRSWGACRLQDASDLLPFLLRCCSLPQQSGLSLSLSLKSKKRRKSQPYPACFDATRRLARAPPCRLVIV